jgi:hypothetical protein
MGGTDICKGELTATSTVVWQHVVTLTEDGDLKPVDQGECIDVLEAYDLWCSECGMLTASEYAAHGIADDWQMQ